MDWFSCYGTSLNAEGYYVKELHAAEFDPCDEIFDSKELTILEISAAKHEDCESVHLLGLKEAVARLKEKTLYCASK